MFSGVLIIMLKLGSVKYDSFIVGFVSLTLRSYLFPEPRVSCIGRLFS